MTITKEQSNYIKLIAIITMAVDHIGYILFPDLMWLRIIGRIAFPLFAYQLAIGYIHTRSLGKYLYRLLIIGILSQIPYFVVANYVLPGQFNTEEKLLLNILFTLVIGLVCLYCIDKKKHITLGFIILTTYILDNYNQLLQFFNVKAEVLKQFSNFAYHYDYGLYGILTIMLMYIFINKKQYLTVCFLGLNIIYVLWFNFSEYQMYSLLAIPFLFKPLNLKFKISSWFFYLFYPVHLAILYGIKILLF